jgi:hypothetical protein
LLSYRQLSANLLETCRVSLSAAGLQNIVKRTAKDITLEQQSLINSTMASPLPPIAAASDIDLYAEVCSDNKDVSLFYDGIGVKRQSAFRKDNPLYEANLQTTTAKKTTKKVNSNIGVLERPNGTFSYLTSGLIIDDQLTYSTIDLLVHELKCHYTNTTKALPLVAITDGATCIRQQLSKAIHPNICIILDWYHLQKKVRNLMSMIAKGSSIEKKEHANNVNNLLWNGNTQKAISYLNNISVKNKEKQQELIHYLKKHITEIIDYEKRQLAGRTIGSGRGEKANDTLIAKRQKKKAMAWSDNGSKALAICKAKYLNN